MVSYVPGLSLLSILASV